MKKHNVLTFYKPTTTCGRRSVRGLQIESSERSFVSKQTPGFENRDCRGNVQCGAKSPASFIIGCELLYWPGKMFIIPGMNFLLSTENREDELLLS